MAEARGGSAAADGDRGAGSRAAGRKKGAAKSSSASAAAKGTLATAVIICQVRAPDDAKTS